MIRGKTKPIAVFLILSITGGGGCSLAVTRPVQEMSNAEVALKAAKDLNADSLVPELYRGAVDAFYKAKRDYRLKDFDNAKKHALRATRIAEQAEFEAYRLGGATPEASSKISAPEGGTPDPESSLGTPPTSETKPGGAPGPRAPDSGPMGPTGAAAPQKQNFTTSYSLDGVPGGGGALPPGGVGNPPGVGNGQDFSNDIRPNQGVTNYDMRLYEEPDKIKGEIRPLDAKPIQGIYDNSPDGGDKDNKGAIKALGSDAAKVKEGFDEMPQQGIPNLEPKEMPSLYTEPKDSDSTKEDNSK